MYPDAAEEARPHTGLLFYWLAMRGATKICRSEDGLENRSLTFRWDRNRTETYATKIVTQFQVSKSLILAETLAPISVI